MATGQHERDRRILHEQAERTMGKDAADALLGHLPPVRWAEVATKRDVAALREDVSRLEGDLGELRDELRADHGKLRDELRADHSKLKDELRTDHGKLRREFLEAMELKTESLEHRLQALIHREGKKQLLAFVGANAVVLSAFAGVVITAGIVG